MAEGRALAAGAVAVLEAEVPLAGGGVAGAGTVVRIARVLADGPEAEYEAWVLADPQGQRTWRSIERVRHDQLSVLETPAIVPRDVPRRCHACGAEHVVHYLDYVESFAKVTLDYACPQCGTPQEIAGAFAGPLTATSR
jgi:hypothetical protein